MTKNLHRDTGAHPLGQHKRSSGVPQVVQPNMAQAGGGDQPSEVPIVIERVDQDQHHARSAPTPLPDASPTRPRSTSAHGTGHTTPQPEIAAPHWRRTGG